MVFYLQAAIAKGGFILSFNSTALVAFSPGEKEIYKTSASLSYKNEERKIQNLKTDNQVRIIPIIPNQEIAYPAAGFGGALWDNVKQKNIFKAIIGEFYFVFTLLDHISLPQSQMAAIFPESFQGHRQDIKRYN